MGRLRNLWRMRPWILHKSFWKPKPYRMSGIATYRFIIRREVGGRWQWLTHCLWHGHDFSRPVHGRYDPREPERDDHRLLYHSCSICWPAKKRFEGVLCECCSARPGVERVWDDGEIVAICDHCFDSLTASFRGLVADGHLAIRKEA